MLFIIPVLGRDYDYSECSEAQPRKKRLFLQQISNVIAVALYRDSLPYGNIWQEWREHNNRRGK